MGKRWLAVLFVVLLCLSLVPMDALASEEADQQDFRDGEKAEVFRDYIDEEEADDGVSEITASLAEVTYEEMIVNEDTEIETAWETEPVALGEFLDEQEANASEDDEQLTKLLAEIPLEDEVESLWLDGASVTVGPIGTGVTKHWSQNSSTWKGMYTGINWSSACAVVAIAIQIARSGLVTCDASATSFNSSTMTGFNPATFAKAGRSAGAISSSSSVTWGKVSSAVPGMTLTYDNTYYSHVGAYSYFPIGSNYEVAKAMATFLEKGYYPIVEGAGSNGGAHYVAVISATYDDDKKTGSVTIIDPNGGQEKNMLSLWTLKQLDNHGRYSGYGSCVLYKSSATNTLTIKYNTNGGTITSDTYSADSSGLVIQKTDSSVKTLKIIYGIEDDLHNASTFGLSRDGYTFIGWSLSKDGSSTVFDQQTKYKAETFYPDLKNGSKTVTMYAIWAKSSGTASEYTLSVNCSVDGEDYENFFGYATVDVYVDGKLAADNVSEYTDSLPVGTSYEIGDFRPAAGYSYDGIQSGQRTGTITSDTVVSLSISEIPFSISETPVAGEYNGHTYWFFQTLVTWYSAKELCENMGGHLATITDAKEQAFLCNLCKGDTNVWIGATDRETEGTWQWVTGESFSYAPWNTGEPSNTITADNDGEHYLQLRPNTSVWNDTRGSKLFFFVCEFDRLLSSTTYTITYNANGGTGAPPAQVKSFGEDIILSETVPARNGYTFYCWAADAGEISFYYQPGDIYDADNDVTLYAVWQKDETPVVTGTRLIVSEANTAPGGEVALTVSLADNPGIAVLRFVVDYDKTVLALTGYEADGLIGWTVDLTSGTALWDSDKNETTNGGVLKLIFKAADGAQEGKTAVTLKSVTAGNLDEQPVAFEVAAGGVTITSRTPGDANGDGAVDIFDLIRLRKHLAGMDVTLDESAADVNGDGAVDIFDLIRMRKYLAGMDVVLQ